MLFKVHSLSRGSNCFIDVACLRRSYRLHAKRIYFLMQRSFSVHYLLSIDKQKSVCIRPHDSRDRGACSNDNCNDQGLILACNTGRVEHVAREVITI